METEKEKKEVHHEEHEHHTKKSRCGKYKKQAPVFVAIVLLAVLLGGFWYYKTIWSKTHLTADMAKTKVTDFINNNLMQAGAKADITSVTKENGMFKVMVSIGSGAQKQEITSYLSEDGTKFFPSVMEIAKIEADKKAAGSNDQGGAKQQAEIPKTDKPTVELFVMSYCPYGTQIEKGILPVLDALGTKIDYSLKFVSYAMHEKKELDENLKQYCIEKNEPAKLSPYLKCFLKDSAQGDACVKSTGVNTTKLASCVDATDKQFKVTENYNDKSKWSNGTYPPFDVNKDDNTKYGVQGSPTLVINGVEASAVGRDSASLLKTICSGFKTEPKECSATLSATAPSPGFGDAAAASGAAASAGGANCGN